MEGSTERFRLRDGYHVHLNTYKPENCQGCTIITHGYSEHSGRYKHVVDYLTGLGLAVITYDFRNHGRNSGRLGYVEDVPQMADDLREIVERTSAFAKGPRFLLGHSTGGAIIALYAINYSNDPKVDGLIFSSPAIHISSHPLLQKVAGVLAKYTPTLPVVYAASIDLLSRDPAVKAACERDPYFYKGKVMARTGYAILEGAKQIQANFGRIKLPFLMLVAGDDRIVDPRGGQWLYERASSKDKTLKRYDGFYHEIFNEIGKEKVLEDLGGWLRQRL